MYTNYTFNAISPRFGGLHFFNPVPVMKLLEVVRIPETSDETFNAMKEWGKNMKKVIESLSEIKRKCKVFYSGDRGL